MQRDASANKTSKGLFPRRVRQMQNSSPRSWLSIRRPDLRPPRLPPDRRGRSQKTLRVHRLFKKPRFRTRRIDPGTPVPALSIPLAATNTPPLSLAERENQAISPVEHQALRTPSYHDPLRGCRVSIRVIYRRLDLPPSYTERKSTHAAWSFTFFVRNVTHYS
jgi:hypothetical protein